jgi:DNA-directed RNA polymerase subunit RPC12/RpoP
MATDIVEADVIDTDARAPGGEPCPACGSPVESADKFCPACGAPNEQAQRPAKDEAEPEQKHFRCNNCGSEVATDAEHRSYVCPFCDSTYVVEFSRDETGRQRPEFIIGFAVTPEEAQQKFYQWLRDNAWFRPGDLVAQAVADKMKGVYLPFWSFSMFAESRWSASIGEYWYRTETYTTVENGKTVTRTRQVRETEWWPLQGRHHRYYYGYLVSGSKGLPQDQAERIKPFQLPALKRYEPYFLAGWFNEEYSVACEQAQAICQQHFYQQERQNIGAFLPGDTHSALSVNTEFSRVNSDLCLLPVYVLSYKYKDKLYRFLVNGQTGKIAGDKPLSWRRIWAAMGIGLLLLLILVAVFFLFASMK